MEALLTHTRLIAALAICLRGVGVSLRLTRSPVTRVGGWMLAAAATWAAAGAAGAFAPVWPSLLIGLAAGLGESRRTGGEELRLPAGREEGRPAGGEEIRRPVWLVVAVDAAVVLAILAFSIPRPAWGTVLALLVALAVGWGLLEAVARRVGPRLRAAAGISAAAALTILLYSTQVSGRGLELLPLPSMLPHIGVATQCEGERVDLGEGMVGWFDAAAGAEGRGAVLLHGFDRQASRQPAACMLRRALVHAGFSTLAVDHPGFGTSRTPAAEAPLEEWDPLVPQMAALDRLSERGIREIAVVGHSMGVTDAMRLMARRPEIRAAFLFGGSGSFDVEADDRDRYERFYRERTRDDPLRLERWREIQTSFYDTERAARGLPVDHAPVVWAVFGREWTDILENEERLYRMLPGPKERWVVERSTHYVSAFLLSGVLVGDYRALREVAAGLRTAGPRLAPQEPRVSDEQRRIHTP